MKKDIKEWNGIGIRVDKSLNGNWFFASEKLINKKPHANDVELVEYCGWHDPTFWRNCMQCVVRKK